MRKKWYFDSLGQMLVPKRGKWSQEVIDFILSWKFAAIDHQRMRLLSGKANEGKLSEDELDEMRMYSLLAHMFSIAQSKARLASKSKTQLLKRRV